ncbi:MAG: alpha/beta hydrolase [Rhodocyclaceae bacterium]|nr:alpha/beta hydrolase [Rhodocyclaceae bacterium]MCA3074757.1 alpha/beta hydrolase [Rhodocyclaceae bacterium]MCA3091617.1 alpha/beta hydrolase [Rhodocyclaceae bacterium]MCA3093969.1 alpha/beta hydrolase [Rhodocyclaceae bacterium]MCA3099240.1 alpha/beta hydrolase [Rhodocyclaceae bacterium]
MSHEPRSIVAGGATFTYLEQGSGTPLVLLHGVGSGARSWVRQLDTLSARCRVVAWDGPGYGGSSALPMDAPDADDYSDALLKLVDALGVGRMHLVGHSLGTIQALRFALRHPDRILGLTLASMSAGHARLPEAERVRLREARLSDLAALGVAGMAKKRGPRLLSDQATDEQRQAVVDTMSMLRPEGFTQAVKLLTVADTKSDLARLPASLPVQVVFGEHDVVTTPASILEVASARPGIPVKVIAGAGHACYIEQPAAFDAIMLDFIEATLRSA